MKKMNEEENARKAVNDCFWGNGGDVTITFKDGTTARIDSFWCIDIEEAVEKESYWMTDEEHAEYLENGTVVNCWLYDETGEMYDGQGDILILDDVTDALFGAHSGLDDIVDVS